MEELARQIISFATAAGPLYVIGAIVLLAVLFVVFRNVKIKLPIPPKYEPVDNSPGSDGSSPSDEKAKEEVIAGIDSGKYRVLPNDPNTPPDPSGGGG